jgi:hypothetical protein
MAIPEAKYRIAKSGAHPGILRSQVALSVSIAKAIKIDGANFFSRSMELNRNTNIYLAYETT